VELIHHIVGPCECVGEPIKTGLYGRVQKRTAWYGNSIEEPTQKYQKQKLKKWRKKKKNKGKQDQESKDDIADMAETCHSRISIPSASSTWRRFGVSHRICQEKLKNDPNNEKYKCTENKQKGEEWDSDDGLVKAYERAWKDEERTTNDNIWSKKLHNIKERWVISNNIRYNDIGEGPNLKLLITKLVDGRNPRKDVYNRK
jgi:hypothetical protein